MIFVVALKTGSLLVNVAYRWVANGALGPELTSGISQPWTDIPVFRVSATPPAQAEELYVYDTTNHSDYNIGGYAIRAAQQAMAGAQQILLATLAAPSPAPALIIPGNAAALSICRCYGSFTDLNNANVNNASIALTLVAQDLTDPTIIYDLSSITIKNTETGLLLASRTVAAALVNGQIQDVNGNPYIDLVRHDYMSSLDLPANSAFQYLFQCDALGAPIGFSLLGINTTNFDPVLFRLDAVSIGQTISGTFNLAANVS